MDYIDEVAGVQVLTVTGPDGKKRRVKQKLPRTPEEEKRFKQGEEMISKSLRNIQELYQYDPSNIIDFSPIIDTFASINNETLADLEKIANIGNIAQDVENFRQMKTSLDDEMFRRQNRELEQNLSQKGLSDSSAGREARAFALRNENLYRQQSDIQAQQYGEGLASQRLARNAQAFGLNQVGRESRLQAANAQYQLGRDQLADIEEKRQAAIQENMNTLNIGSGLVGADLNKNMGSNAEQLALGTFQAQNADSLNRYAATVNAQNQAYQNQLAAYKARPVSFKDMALQAAGKVVGNAAGNVINSAMFG